MSKEKVPLISVIVPVYKAEKYLHRCVDSLLAQIFQNFEVLLVDDGSPDRAGAICDEYAKKDSRVRVFHKENGGVGSARNLGIEKSRGEWIAFLDSDDSYKTTFLSSLYKNSFGVDSVACGFEIRLFNGIYYSTVQFPRIIMESKLDSIWCLLGELNAEHYIWNRIYKSEIIKRNHIQFELISTGEDTLFNLLYMSKSASMTLIDDVEYIHYNNQLCYFVI